MSKQIVCIVYDSIENSVFYGQVLTPLVRKKITEPETLITLISFEKTQPSESIIQLIEEHNITCIIYRRLPFLGTHFLYNPTRTVHYFLRNHLEQIPYTLIARGPHAGFISIHAAIDHLLCEKIVIQARGILADEFLYVQSKKTDQTYIHTLLQTIRYRQYKRLEKAVYNYVARYGMTRTLTVEAVSPSLKSYLMAVHHLKDAMVTVATNDIPEKISDEQRQLWRQQVRAELKILPEALVYCYNGSAKAWQCPEHVIQHFEQILAKHQNSFLLILTQQRNRFSYLLQKANINPSNYYICTIAHSEVFRYLAACDMGILFREANIINWVSRPTKMLEYEAVSLPIIHNNTVAMLTNNPQHTAIE